jgi:hypothetical protein
MDALLRGRAAFAGERGEGPIPVMYRSVHEPAPDLRPLGVPDEVAALVEAGMAKDPAVRIPDAATLRRRIQAVRDHRAGGAAGPPTARVVVPAPVAAPAGPAPPPPAPVASPPPPPPGPNPDATTRADPPEDRGRTGLMIGLVVALLVLIAVVAGAIVLLSDDGDGEETAPTTTVPPTESSIEPTTTSTTTTSTSTTTTSTTTTTTTTQPTTTTTTTQPVADDESEAVALITERYPGWSIVDTSSFRPNGAGAVVAEDADGKRAVFLFGGGRLIGTDASEPSLGPTVVDVTGNDVRIAYDLWAAGAGPPEPPSGQAEVVLRWPGTDQFVLQEGEFPPTDPAVDGHR